MKTSPEINELAAALMLVQAQVGNLPKTKKGQRAKYLPLEDVTEALTEPMSSNGLAYVQMLSTPPVEYGPSIALVTRLMHVSGQWLEDTLIMPLPQLAANEAQMYGAAATYARRYALTAMFGIAADDDTDAEIPEPKRQASSNGHQPPAPHSQPQPVDKPTGRSQLTPAEVKAVMAKKTANDNNKPPSDKQRKYAISSLAAVTAGDDERHAVTRFLFGKESANDLTASQCSALIDWIGYKQTGDDWLPEKVALAEAAEIVKAATVNDDLFAD